MNILLLLVMYYYLVFQFRFYHFCNQKFIGNLGCEHLNATVPLCPTKRVSHVIKIRCNTGVIIEAYVSCVSGVATLQLSAKSELESYMLENKERCDIGYSCVYKESIKCEIPGFGGR